MRKTKTTLSIISDKSIVQLIMTIYRRVEYNFGKNITTHTNLGLIITLTIFRSIFTCLRCMTFSDAESAWITISDWPASQSVILTKQFACRKRMVENQLYAWPRDAYISFHNRVTKKLNVMPKMEYKEKRSENNHKENHAVVAQLIYKTNDRFQGVQLALTGVYLEFFARKNLR